MLEKELLSRLEALERRVAQLEQGAPLATATPAASDSLRPQPSTAAFDAAVVAKCILIVGGAYVLRALTELKVLPNGIGVALGFAYALFWIWRSRTVLFTATGAAIAGALSWEAATRFHIIGAAGGGGLIAIAALVLLWIARTRYVPIYAAIAGVMAIVASIGVAIGTGDALYAAMTVAIIGVVISMQQDGDTYLTAGIAAANDSIAITLIGLTAFGKTPHDPRVVQGVLLAIACAWLFAPVAARMRRLDDRLRWPEIGQAVAATVISIGGVAVVGHMYGGSPMLASTSAIALALAGYALSLRGARTAIGGALTIAAAFSAAIAMVMLLDGAVLAAFWSVAGVASAFVARRVSWSLWFAHAAVWSTGGLIIAFGTTTALIVTAVLSTIALTLMPATASSYVRLTMLTVTSAALVMTAMRLVPPAGRSTTAFEWSALLAVAIAILSLLSSRIAEAATLARIVLFVAGLKLLVEDLRVGQATSLVASLALYGGAMLLFARRPKTAAPSPQPVTSIV